MKDRRALVRQKVDFNAKLIFVDAARVLDCNVVDMTADGARLELFAAMELPERAYLWENHTNSVFECTVIWRKPGCAGVRFANSCQRILRLAIVEACALGSGRPLRLPAGPTAKRLVSS
jgi:hypothetical protein